MHLAACVVTAPLPDYRFFDTMVDEAPHQKINEQRHSQYRDRNITRRKVRARHPCIESPKRPNPQNKNDPALPTRQPRYAQCQCWQPEEKKDIKHPPASQVDRTREEKRKVLRPSLHHLRSRPVHACRQSLRCIPEPNNARPALDVMRQRYVFQHLRPNCPMPTHRKVSIPLHHQKLPIRRGQSSLRIIDLLWWIHTSQLRKNQWHHRMLPEPAHNLPWRV